MIKKYIERLRLWLMKKLLTEYEMKRATLSENQKELLCLAIDDRVTNLERARIVDFAADRGNIREDIADLVLMRSTTLYASFREAQYVNGRLVIRYK